MDAKLEIITGKQHIDVRGILNFFNDFDMNLVKRMYTIEHPDINIVRAWQGHKIETKWFLVLTGAFKIVLVKPNNWVLPDANADYQEYILHSNISQILKIPGGHASGFKAIEPGSKLMIFSDLDTEESLDDDYRFDKKLWYNW